MACQYIIICLAVKALMPTMKAQTSLHIHSLISTIVICYLLSIISDLATCKVFNINLVSVAEQSGLPLRPSHDKHPTITKAHLKLFVLR